MAEEPVVAAEPTPAEAPQPEPEQQELEFKDSNLENWTERQRNTYFKDGTIPAAKEEKSAAPEESEAVAPEPAPEPEPGKQQEPKKSPQNAETRKKQLGAEIQEKLSERRRISEELEILKAQRDILKSQASAKPPESPPAQEAPGSTRPVRPKIDQYESYEEYESALDKYEESLADYKAADRIQREKVEYMRQQQLRAHAEYQQNVRQKLDASVAEAKKAHPDFDEVLATASQVPVTPHMQLCLENAEHPGEIMYHLAAHPDEARKMAALHPFAVTKELAVLDATFAGTIKQAPATPQVTGAKPPPTQLGGTNAAPADEMAAAVASGDFRRYMATANAREMKRA
jgi:hypothetical protein